MKFGDKWVIFEITDGTPANTVDLISADKAFGIVDWFPTVSEAKDGGIYVTSLFEDGSRLIHRSLANSFEELRLINNNVTEDALAEALIKFRQLLQAATSYWTSAWGLTPVYLKLRGYRETNTRYATIINWSAPADTMAYFKDPTKVYGNVSKMNLSIIIERDQFQDAPIGSDNSLETFAVQKHWLADAYFGTYRNDIDEIIPTDDLMLVGNSNARLNLNGVYFHDASAGTWSVNLDYLGFQAILPSTVQIGDALYIGASCEGSSCIFSNIVFDLDTLMPGADITWEYYNGVTWSTFAGYGFADNTDNFGIEGLQSVSWEKPDDWTAVNLNTLFGGSAPNVSRYWVRAYVTDPGAGTSPPRIAKYALYSATWNNFGIYGSQFNCDIAPQLRYDIDMQLEEVAHQILIGTRSIHRGDKFVPNIQLSNIGNFDHIDVVDVPVMDGNFASNYQAPTGIALKATNIPPAETSNYNVVAMHVTEGSADFSGQYRVFVRYQLSGSVLDEKILLRLFDENTDQGVERLLKHSSGDPTGIYVADFGTMNFATKRLVQDDVVDIDLRLGYESLVDGASSEYFWLFDITFIPVDEWSGKYTLGPGTREDTFMYRIDGTRSPKYKTIASLMSNFEEQQFHSYLARDQVTSPKLQLLTDQNIYFMVFDSTATASTFLKASFGLTLGVKLFGINRFFSQRGSL